MEKSTDRLRLRKLLVQAFCAARVHAVFRIAKRNEKAGKIATLWAHTVRKIGFRQVFFYSVLKIGAAV
jgi:hypothetical protein